MTANVITIGRVREAGGSALAVGISSGAALALQAAARGVSLNGLVLYEPPFIETDGHPPSFDMQKSRLDQFVASGDRAGAVRFFMTDSYGARSSPNSSARRHRQARIEEFIWPA